MAHLLRKIRQFRDAFPSLPSILKFYLKLRRILRDGERLQDKGIFTIGDAYAYPGWQDFIRCLFASFNTEWGVLWKVYIESYLPMPASLPQ